MYGRFAEIYDAIYAFKDYKAESDLILSLIKSRSPRATTLLDVGCGTGSHLAFLAKEFQCVGLDNSDPQLEAARKKLPNVEFVLGDIRDFDLHRTFDVVLCLFGVIGYSLTIEGLDQAAGCLAAHLSPGGVLLVEPWLTRDRFQEGRFDLITAQTESMKIARTNTTRKEGDVSVLDFHFLTVTRDGSEHFQETHRLGLFTHEDYRHSFTGKGLDVNFDQQGLDGRGLYICRNS